MTYAPAALFVITVIALLCFGQYTGSRERARLGEIIASFRTDQEKNSGPPERFTQVQDAEFISAISKNPLPPMLLVVSMAVVGCALYMLISGQYTAEGKYWVYGSVGTLLGYWLNR